MSLSDLDLVQQAMAPTEPGAQQNQSTSPTLADKSTNGATKKDEIDDPLAGIDLSQLNDADRAALQPILDALKAASGAEGQEGGDLDYEGILTQLDAAGDVADTLEGRLDKLLANLGEMEKDQQEQCDEAAPKAEAKK
ncbi:hypothetical protein A1Q2_01581 [Trichosporon asahii var. asahii CBS 8904]|uniref:Uncharacterized protein n=2 Tax=Trichosporon asahii var. asahii TaxID=189963 RepID=K1VUD3_TRIAC|nr:hypothetical protein A1Q1_05125 [Trichosporon asahii var. asahii CBS 2479]EJT46296.1 hypothetical protein A1Q1_05125 [Trichosporon asahii var. asahii CBS 2479]EKD04106.1 hypothetical protein A1Q2_01581 [Trichosporon asahii var. asahii CBS 8904]